MSISFKKVMPKKTDWIENIQSGLNFVGKSIDSFAA